MVGLVGMIETLQRGEPDAIEVGHAQSPEDSVKGRHECGEFRCREVTEEILRALQLLGVQGGDDVGTEFGESHQGRPAVGGVRAAYHKSSGSEPVEKTGHVARGDAECLAELPLGHRPVVMKLPENSRPCPGEPAFDQATGHGVAQQHRQLEHQVQSYARTCCALFIVN